MLVFNFHHVEKNIRHADRKHISISPQGLRYFIRTLRLMGMKIVSLRDAMQADRCHEGSNRHVVLTFDDGYENNYLEALPVLEEEQCPATIFVLPGLFGGTNHWDQGHLPEHERDRLMSLEQMKIMAASPFITLGSHGLYHRDMTTLSDEQLRESMTQSYEVLAQEFGDSFLPVLAYPWGHYSQREMDALEDTPYKYAMTVETRPWTGEDHRFQIPRFSAYYRDGNPAVFFAKLCRHKLLFA